MKPDHQFSEPVTLAAGWAAILRIWRHVGHPESWARRENFTPAHVFLFLFLLDFKHAWIS